MPKVLFLGANPSDTTRLALDREVREIKHRLRGSPEGRSIEVEKEWAVRPEDLQQHLLRHRPDVVHFSGHGSRAGQILVDDGSGSSVPISKEALGHLFGVLGESTGVVVLNACYSAEQARVIVEHIDCVVGMSSAIKDKPAIAFAGAFYQALGFRTSLHKAFQLGRLQIELVLGPSSADIPTLLCKKGVNPDHVYLRDTSA